MTGPHRKNQAHDSKLPDYLDRPTQNLEKMATLETAAPIGSAAVGWGPQRFGSDRRHQRALPTIHAALDTVVAVNALCFQEGTAAVPTATATSIGK